MSEAPQMIGMVHTVVVNEEMEGDNFKQVIHENSTGL